MKKILFSPVILILILFNSCIVDRESENSFYLNQINKIELVSSKTIFFSENKEEDFKLTVSIFDKDNRPFLNNVKVPYIIYLGDSIIKKPTLDLSKKGKYKLRVMFPTRKPTFSNEIEIEVVDGTYINELVLDFANETRTNYSVTKNGTFDFTLKAIGPKGEIPGVADQILRNLKLKVGKLNLNRLKEITIEELGLIEVQASVFGANSNVLKINSREDIAFPIKEFQVVFHVFSNGYDISDAQISAQLNSINLAFGGGVRSSFKRNLNAVDANFRFKLAEKDPEGNFLFRKGYNKIPNDVNFADAEDLQLYLLKFNSLWDPNQYINVFIEDLSSLGAAGYAYLPFLTEPVVDGLFPIYPADTELFYPIMIALDFRIFNGQYVDGYTLAHELGHYLGLRHTFQDCQNGDYCDDTQPHALPTNPSLVFASNRNTCSGEQFISTNFMDYVSAGDNFSFDQKNRMTKVYENALFMPKDLNSPGGRVSPFKRGIFDPSIKPIICNF